MRKSFYFSLFFPQWDLIGYFIIFISPFMPLMPVLLTTDEEDTYPILCTSYGRVFRSLNFFLLFFFVSTFEVERRDQKIYLTNHAA